jgi:hypothetical protein
MVTPEAPGIAVNLNYPGAESGVDQWWGASVVGFIVSAWPLVGLWLAIAANIIWVAALVYSLHVF